MSLARGRCRLAKGKDARSVPAVRAGLVRASSSRGPTSPATRRASRRSSRRWLGRTQPRPASGAHCSWDERGTLITHMGKLQGLMEVFWGADRSPVVLLLQRQVRETQFQLQRDFGIVTTAELAATLRGMRLGRSRGAQRNGPVHVRFASGGTIAGGSSLFVQRLENRGPQARDEPRSAHKIHLLPKPSRSRVLQDFRPTAKLELMWRVCFAITKRASRCLGFRSGACVPASATSGFAPGGLSTPAAGTTGNSGTDVLGSVSTSIILFGAGVGTCTPAFACWMLSFFRSLTWDAGCRISGFARRAALGRIQLKMGRKVLGWWPSPRDEVQTFLTRSARTLRQNWRRVFHSVDDPSCCAAMEMVRSLGAIRAGGRWAPHGQEPAQADLGLARLALATVAGFSRWPP